MLIFRFQGKLKTCRCNDNDLQDIGVRKIGPDLSIEPLQKHFCFFDICSVSPMENQLSMTSLKKSRAKPASAYSFMIGK